MTEIVLLSKEQFDGHVGENFRFSPAVVAADTDEASEQPIEAAEAELTLEEIDELPAHSPDGKPPARTPFALLFRGPDSPILNQGNWRVEGTGGAGSPAGEIFIVPLGPDGQGGVRYEAVFN